MLKRFLAATFAAGLVLTGAAPPAIAETPQTQHTLTSAAARTQLRDEIARLWSKTIDAIEFRRQADGKFVRHQT